MDNMILMMIVITIIIATATLVGSSIYAPSTVSETTVAFKPRHITIQWCMLWKFVNSLVNYTETIHSRYT